MLDLLKKPVRIVADDLDPRLTDAESFCQAKQCVRRGPSTSDDLLPL